MVHPVENSDAKIIVTRLPGTGLSETFKQTGTKIRSEDEGFLFVWANIIAFQGFVPKDYNDFMANTVFKLVNTVFRFLSRRFPRRFMWKSQILPKALVKSVGDRWKGELDLIT